MLSMWSSIGGKLWIRPCASHGGVYGYVSGRIRREEGRHPIRNVIFSEDDARKRRKQQGPDKLKGELYRSMEENGLTCAYNKVIESGVVPRGRKMSRTVMLPKKKRPVGREHRPLALTNVGHKLFMGIMKGKIVEHLDRNRLICDFQARFTGGRRLDENLFIVKYCIEEMYRKGKELVGVAIDFKKAFDSVGRVALVRAFKF